MEKDGKRSLDADRGSYRSEHGSIVGVARDCILMSDFPRATASLSDAYEALNKKYALRSFTLWMF